MCIRLARLSANVRRTAGIHETSVIISYERIDELAYAMPESYLHHLELASETMTRPTFVATSEDEVRFAKFYFEKGKFVLRVCVTKKGKDTDTLLYARTEENITRIDMGDGCDYYCIK